MEVNSNRESGDLEFTVHVSGSSVVIIAEYRQAYASYLLPTATEY